MLLRSYGSLQVLADYLGVGDFFSFCVAITDNKRVVFLAILNFSYWDAGGGWFLVEVCQPQRFFPCWFVRALLLTFKVQNRTHLFAQAFA